MIRNRLPDFLAARGWTAYRLAKEAGIPEPSAYRLVGAPAGVGRIATLNTLCRVLECQPGDLMEYVPDRPPKTKGGK